MDPKAKRRVADVEKLKQLRSKHSDIVTRLAVAGEPVSRVRLVLSMPTAKSASYPREVENHIEIEIELPNDYPTKPPHVLVLSRVWNPNVYENGTVCIGPIWMPTEGLDLFVIKLVRLFAFDPKIVNPQSPANLAAANWYETTRARHPSSFPTIDLGSLLVSKERRQPKMTWTDMK